VYAIHDTGYTQINIKNKSISYVKFEDNLCYIKHFHTKVVFDNINRFFIVDLQDGTSESIFHARLNKNMKHEIFPDYLNTKNYNVFAVTNEQMIYCNIYYDIPDLGKTINLRELNIFKLNDSIICFVCQFYWVTFFNLKTSSFQKWIFYPKGIFDAKFVEQINKTIIFNSNFICLCENSLLNEFYRNTNILIDNIVETDKRFINSMLFAHTEESYVYNNNFIYYVHSHGIMKSKIDNPFTLSCVHTHNDCSHGDFINITTNNIDDVVITYEYATVFVSLYIK